MKLAEKLALAAGALLLGFLVYRIGPAALWAQIAQLSWGFLLVLGVHAVAVLFNTLGWRLMLPPERRGIPFLNLAGMLIVGEAVNALTPAAVVGGEVVRASLLGRRMPLVTAVGSVGMAATAQFLSQSLFVLSGVPFVLKVLGDGGLRTGLIIFSSALTVFVALVLYIGWSRDGSGRIRRQLERIPWFRARWAAPDGRWRALADETLGAMRSRPGDFARAVAFSFLAWQAGVVEVYVIARLLRAGVGWRTAFVIEVMTVAIEGVLFFVPAKMGTQEGGQYVIFLALGLDPVKGVALGFVRRLRALTWAVGGLAVLAAHQSRRPKSEPVPSDGSR